MFEIIRNKLKSKMEGISSIQEVHDFPTWQFNGYPAVVIASTRLEQDFQTTTQNRRTYVFTAYVFQDVEQCKEPKEQTARRIIESVVDDIVESFDKDQFLSGIESDLPSNGTMIISYPLLSSIYTSAENPKLLVGELEIKVIISFDITK